LFDKESMKLLKEMTEAFGPSGFEREVNSLFKKHMMPYADEVITDKLGSVGFAVKGTSDRPRVLVTGHTDEVGFIISSVTEEGYLTFNQLGGWFDQVLLGQRVVIRGNKGDVHGIIASKPPHILPEEERKKVVEKKDMFIDIGATSRQEAEECGLKVGDPVVPYSTFNLIQGGKVAMGKAFDDRIGAFVFGEAMKRMKKQKMVHPNTFYGVATVQEEVGLRGAQTIAHVVDPDVAIILEVDIAGDVPGIKAQDAQAKMGRGPSMLTFDAGMIPNQPLKEWVIDVAKQCQIPLQLSQMKGGRTDGAPIHMSRAGCPTVAIGVPTRHIHSHSGLLSLKDTENTVRLIMELVKRLDAKTVEGFTAL
jgi:putative aminopeptidase FrvX